MYVTQQTNILSEGISNIYNLIKNIFTILSKNDKIVVVNEMDLIHKKNKHLYDSMVEILLILDEYPEFEKEFIRCGDVLTMAEYIFSDDELIKRYTPFICEIISNFCNLLNYKLDSMSSIDLSYEKEYREFRRYISKQKDFFYSEIYIDEADDVIDN